MTHSEARPRPTPIPVGPRLEAVLGLAYRARRAVLLEGPTGIGKSEIVRHVADRLGIATLVLDLSLLEPPDLVGLPVVKDGRTSYALPSALPSGGAGILMLEELNRAERYIQQPALQLLSARKLHEYELPADWVCFAAVNPESADYQVTSLDRALRARFLELSVRADRAAWLAWADPAGVHPAIVSLVRSHERVFDDVPPRTWTYASRLLAALRPDEINDTELVRDALSGYLPPVWTEALLASRAGWSAKLAFDPRLLLSKYDPGGDLAKQIRGHRDRGETDRLDEIVTRLVPLLAGPEAGVLAARKELTLESFEALLADLPGDQRERLSEALAGNATVVALVDADPASMLLSYASHPAHKRVAAWGADPFRRHRAGLVVTAVRAYLEQHPSLPDVRKSNAVRTSLGQLLAQVDERWAMPLVLSMKKLGITPIRPT